VKLTGDSRHFISVHENANLANKPVKTNPATDIQTNRFSFTIKEAASASSPTKPLARKT
jgi:hypothetical protein